MKLKTMRIIKGETLKTLAKKVGISVPTMRLWEIDPQSITLKNIRKLCEILECSMQDVDEWK